MVAARRRVHPARHGVVEVGLELEVVNPKFREIDTAVQGQQADEQHHNDHLTPTSLHQAVHKFLQGVELCDEKFAPVDGGLLLGGGAQQLFDPEAVVLGGGEEALLISFEEVDAPRIVVTSFLQRLVSHLEGFDLRGHVGDLSAEHVDGVLQRCLERWIVKALQVCDR